MTPMRLGSFIYVSGPISADPLRSTRMAVLAGERLRQAGYVPIVPHLSILWQMIVPVTYEEWIELDLMMLTRCDALLRLPGISPGADREVERARQLGIPVYEQEIDIVSHRSLGGSLGAPP